MSAIDKRNILVLFLTAIVQIHSEEPDFHSIFHTPHKKYDEFEILERSSFDSERRPAGEIAKCITETPKAVANAQVMVNFAKQERERARDMCENVKYPYVLLLPQNDHKPYPNFQPHYDHYDRCTRPPVYHPGYYPKLECHHGSYVHPSQRISDPNRLYNSYKPNLPEMRRPLLPWLPLDYKVVPVTIIKNEKCPKIPEGNVCEAKLTPEIEIQANQENRNVEEEILKVTTELVSYLQMKDNCAKPYEKKKIAGVLSEVLRYLRLNTDKEQTLPADLIQNTNKNVEKFVAGNLELLKCLENLGDSFPREVDNIHAILLMTYLKQLQFYLANGNEHLDLENEDILQKFYNLVIFKYFDVMKSKNDVDEEGREYINALCKYVETNQNEQTQYVTKSNDGNLSVVTTKDVEEACANFFSPSIKYDEALIQSELEPVVDAINTDLLNPFDETKNEETKTIEALIGDLSKFLAAKNFTIEGSNLDGEDAGKIILSPSADESSRLPEEENLESIDLPTQSPIEEEIEGTVDDEAINQGEVIITDDTIFENSDNNLKKLAILINEAISEDEEASKQKAVDDIAAAIREELQKIIFQSTGNNVSEDVNKIVEAEPTKIGNEAEESDASVPEFEETVAPLIEVGLDQLESEGTDNPNVVVPIVDAPIVDAPIVDVPIVDVPIVDAPIVDVPIVDIVPINDEIFVSTDLLDESIGEDLINVENAEGVKIEDVIIEAIDEELQDGLKAAEIVNEVENKTNGPIEPDIQFSSESDVPEETTESANEDEATGLSKPANDEIENQGYVWETGTATTDPSNAKKIADLISAALNEDLFTSHNVHAKENITKEIIEAIGEELQNLSQESEKSEELLSDQKIDDNTDNEQEVRNSITSAINMELLNYHIHQLRENKISNEDFINYLQTIPIADSLSQNSLIEAAVKEEEELEGAQVTNTFLIDSLINAPINDDVLQNISLTVLKNDIEEIVKNDDEEERLIVGVLKYLLQRYIDDTLGLQSRSGATTTKDKTGFSMDEVINLIRLVTQQSEDVTEENLQPDYVEFLSDNLIYFLNYAMELSKNKRSETANSEELLQLLDYAVEVTKYGKKVSYETTTRKIEETQTKSYGDKLEDLLKIKDDLEYIKLKLDALGNLQSCQCNKTKSYTSQSIEPYGYQILTPKSCHCYQCGQSSYKRVFPHDMDKFNPVMETPIVIEDSRTEHGNKEMRESLPTLGVVPSGDKAIYEKSKPEGLDFGSHRAKSNPHPEVTKPLIYKPISIGRQDSKINIFSDGVITGDSNPNTCMCGKRLDNGRCPSCPPYESELNDF